MLRGSCVLPNDFDKQMKVAVFIPQDNASKIESVINAGADKVGFDDLIAEIKAGKINYDRYLASASSMSRLKEIASILGSRGLMPNAKIGTLTDNPEVIMHDMKNKIVFFKSGKSGLIQCRIGTVAMTSEKIIENITFLIKHIMGQTKNSAIGKGFIKSLYLKSTMGDCLKINYSELF